MLRSLDAGLLLWAHGEYTAGRLIELMGHLPETNPAGGPRDGQTGLQLLDILQET